MQTSFFRCCHLFLPWHSPKFLPSLLHVSHLLSLAFLFCSPSKNLLCSLYILYLGNPTWSTYAGHSQTHIQPWSLPDTPGCQLDLSKWVPHGNLKLSWPRGAFPLAHSYLFLISVNGNTIHQHVRDRRKRSPFCMCGEILCFIHLFMLFPLLRRPFQLLPHPFLLETFCLSFKNQF